MKANNNNNQIKKDSIEFFLKNFCNHENKEENGELSCKK